MAAKPWTSQFRHWCNQTALNSLEQAYSAAIAIQGLEQKHFAGEKIAPIGDRVSVYNYFKSQLERDLLKVRWHLTQFQATNFLLGFQEGGLPESEILAKLETIETIIGKYRTDAETDRLLGIAPQQALGPDGYSDEVKDAEEDLSQIEGDKPNKPRLFHLNRRLTPDYEQEVIQKLRMLRQQKKIAIRYLTLLVVLPLAVQILSKNLIYSPLINHFKIEVARLEQLEIKEEMAEQYFEEFSRYKEVLEIKNLLSSKPISEEEMQHRITKKAEELLREAAKKSQEGWKNFLADVTSLVTFCVLLALFPRQFTIVRQFFSRYFLGLSDVTKVFIFILLTDMFVGFHSAHGWEVILENLTVHFGLPENRQLIYLFIATVPVILDSTFKLLIFNYFTRQSPASVAILEKMQK
ncbi:MAG: CemA family protein [Microcystaceae cyanobacterium]